MPIYEYKCKKCGCEFEALVKNSSEQVKCEKCGKSETERKLSVFSASVKSGGKCANESVCPAAGSHQCSGNCGCMHG